MKEIIKFLAFILFSIVLFFISSPIMLGSIFIIIFLLAFTIKLPIVPWIKYNIYLLPFEIFVGFMNGMMMQLEGGILSFIRLFLVCNMTYIYSKTMTTMQFAKVIEKVLSPLEWIHIHVKDISLMVAMALNFIPILKQEMIEIRESLKVKGLKWNIGNTKYWLKPLLLSIFNRMDELEITLKVKGYES